VDVAKRAVDAYNRRDVDGFLAELATPDYELHAGTARALGGDEYRGREGVERFDRDRSENWEELQIVAEEFRDLGDRVLVLGRLKGRGKASGAHPISRLRASTTFAATGSAATGPSSIVPKDCGRQDCRSRRAGLADTASPGRTRPF